MEILNQNPETTNKRRDLRLSGNLTLKGVLIVALTLLLLIPAAFISDLVNERSDRREEVEAELSSKWASAQTVKGPVLVIPCVNKREIKLTIRITAPYFPKALISWEKSSPRKTVRAAFSKLFRFTSPSWI